MSIGSFHTRVFICLLSFICLDFVHAQTSAVRTSDSQKRAGSDWWALQPLKKPTLPQVSGASNAIDAFVLKRLHAQNLSASARATPREIARRMSFGLVGLPPTPEDVREFRRAYAENSKNAIEGLARQLLNSRHFGERWGRHWLDVVRFGESQGFERDKLRENSWHYRDWVIEALNNDMPYDEFVRLQIAGDLLKPEDAKAVIATGFLVAGPWDEVGQNQQSVAMKAIVRQDEIEDYVGTVSQTFLGLTVNCARCHDHKFDPISQREYYQIASSLSGVAHGSRDVFKPETKTRKEELSRRIRSVRNELSAIDCSVRTRLQQMAELSTPPLISRIEPVARWEFESNVNDQVGSAHATFNPNVETRDGRLVLDGSKGFGVTSALDFELREKTIEAWVQLSTLQQRAGAVVSVHSTRGGEFDAIVYAEREPKRWMAGSDYFRRTENLEAAPENAADNHFVHLAVTYDGDGMVAVYRDGIRYGQPYQSSGPQTFKAGEWKVMFGLRTGTPHESRQLNGLLETAQIYDRALTPDEVKRSYEIEKSEITHAKIIAELTDSEKTERAALEKRLVSLTAELTQHRPDSTYAVVPRQAGVVHLLNRGDPRTPGSVVSPGAIASVIGMDPDFGLASDSPDSARRVAIVNWITHPKNPLLARVIVNRLWHYHFGIGIVSTPNDFGFNGGRPSHPDLLDWLACELVESGWSLKHIHHLIVTSATYLQSSRVRPDCMSLDRDNRLLWRKSPSRLEAEALRDSILSVAGQLNRTYGGASYRDFTSYVNNTQFYEVVDRDDSALYRRTVYRTWIRSGRNHLLDAFDCPDPSTTAPKRAVTTTPIQSLALMNNSFVLRMSEKCADRVTNDSADELERISRVYWLAFGRSPSEEESILANRFIASHGLAAFCRVLFNSNEFIYVD